MNLVCFPHYTCGGLLIDIFQKTFSPVGNNGGIDSVNHSIGKIGDAAGIFDQFDPTEFYKRLDQHINDKIIGPDSWVGTHCHPDLLDTSLFNRVISVTTTTTKSKLYRWSRVYHHHYTKSGPWTVRQGQNRIDKERETAKNYISSFLPSNNINVINIEFAEIVEEKVEFRQLVQGFEFKSHMERWKSLNEFLYCVDFWNSNALQRFYEAELEVGLNRFYVYE